MELVALAPSAECLFCSRDGQPAVLDETQSLYLMPDKFPLLPGHTLIIAKAHRRCFGDSLFEEHEELEALTERVRAFLTDAYGGPVWIMENGVSGQTVFHAHLHLIPRSID